MKQEDTAMHEQLPAERSYQAAVIAFVVALLAIACFIPPLAHYMGAHNSPMIAALLGVTIGIAYCAHFIFSAPRSRECGAMYSAGSRMRSCSHRWGPYSRSSCSAFTAPRTVGARARTTRPQPTCGGLFFSRVTRCLCVLGETSHRTSSQSH